MRGAVHLNINFSTWKKKLFWRREIAKKLEEELEVQYCDVDTVDGLTEACMYQIMSTPSLVLIDEKGDEIESWKGTLPEIDYIRKKIFIR